MAILVLNAGSSSLKTAVFERGRRVLEARVSAIGAAPELTLGAERRPLAKEIDHAGALSACLSALRETSAAAIDAVAHRVVHGGDLFDAPQRLDRAAMARLESLNALAPLHNPTALAVIRAAEAALPAAAQIACFDTAFHARQPEVARRFAIPDREATAGLTRYGFHGLSYQSLLERLNPIPPRLLACHLGAGASLCAIRGGMSVATTMGYSPLDGLTMGTRSGAMDPSAALELARRVGVDEAETLLTRESGLLGLSGETAEMRALERSASAEAAFAIEHFTYWAARHAGSMIAAMGGIDAIAFTGGVGERSGRIRGAIAAHLAWTGLTLRAQETCEGAPEAAATISAEDSPVAAYVIAADEEGVIARAAAALLSAETDREEKETRDER